VVSRAATLFLILLAPVAMAAEGGREEAMLYASAYAEMPADAAVTIVFRRESAINEDLRPVVAEGLERHGIVVDLGAALTLTVDTDIAAMSGGQGPLAIEGRAGSSGVDSLRFDLQMPLGRIGGEPSRRRYRVDLSLGETGAAPLWRATAIAHVTGSRAFSLAARLLKSLLDRLGENARGERLALD